MIHALPWHDLLRGASDSATGSLIGAIWQGALLAGAAALGLRLLPKTPASARFAIWFAVFLLVAALPLAAAWTHPATATAGLQQAPWLTVSSTWSEAILGIWAAASLARAITLTIAAFRVHALWNRATPIAAAEWRTPDFQTLGREVEVCSTDEIDRPCVIGFFSPKILIPSWLLDKLSPEEMSHIILHEAGHLRRADDWLNLLQKIALVIFPLNPALIWVERRLCFERELACDERVLRATGSPVAYASCLASLAEHRMTRRGIALVMGALGRESELGQRVLRILSRGERMRPAHTRVVIGAAMLALIAGTAGLERSPQLIGFASSSNTQQEADMAISRAPLSATSSPARRSAYQPVVFRPSPPTPAATQQGSTHAGPAGDERKAAPVRMNAVHSTARQQHLAQAPSGWVMMTSTTTWSDSGARVVFTSIRTSPPLARYHSQATDLRSSSAPEERTSGDPVQAQAQQVYPYAAAVPVRGGWLIIQL